MLWKAKNCLKFLSAGEVEKDGMLKSPTQMDGFVMSNAVKECCSMFNKFESVELGGLYTLINCVSSRVFLFMKEACKSSIPCSKYICHFSKRKLSLWKIAVPCLPVEVSVL